jgi:hypothetical protein
MKRLMGACDASKLDELNQAIKAALTYGDCVAVRVVTLERQHEELQP